MKAIAIVTATVILMTGVTDVGEGQNRKAAEKSKGGDATIIAIVGDTAQRPLEQAELVAVLAKKRAVTGADGIVRMTLPVGQETFLVRRLGYQPQQFTLTLTAGDTLRFGAVLLPDPVQLTDIEVSAERTNGVMVGGRLYTGKMRGFANRLQFSAAPRSSFFTPDDIEKFPPTARLTDALRRAGMRIRFNANENGRYETAICPRGQGGLSPPPAIIYLDGMRMTGNGASFDFNSISWVQLGGIEIYKSTAEIPAELLGIGAECVVMLWTK